MSIKTFVLILFVLSGSQQLFADEDEGGVCIECLNHEPPITSYAINRIESYMCTEPEIGKPTVVDDYLGVDHIRRSFRLTKTSPTSYLAEINPQFYPKKFQNESNAKYASRARATQKEYVSTMTKCFKSISPYLKSPSGEKLEIKLGTDKKIPKVVITVSDKNYRSKQHSFAENMDCPTMLHETLHLFGLGDEYSEKLRGYITNRFGWHTDVDNKANLPAKDLNNFELAYACRAVTPSYSIMNDPSVAVQSLFPHATRKLQWCRCYLNPAECAKNVSVAERNRFNKTGQVNCPKNYVRLATDEVIRTENDHEAREILGIAIHLNVPILQENPSQTDIFNKRGESTSVVPAQQSLLRPAHFRFITNPFCWKKNKDFMKCAQLSYQNKDITGKCPPETKECKDNLDWLNK
jgi:hypothetical protein